MIFRNINFFKNFIILRLLNYLIMSLFYTQNLILTNKKFNIYSAFKNANVSLINTD